MQQDSKASDSRAKPTSAPRPKSRWRRFWVPRWLVSMKFAIWIAVALAVASVAGVLLQEFFPMRSAADAEALRARLPDPVFRAFGLLQLHDVFRAFWFRGLLGLLAVSLIFCSSQRFRSAFKQAMTLRPFREPQALQSLPHSAVVYHASPELFDAVVGRLRRRFYFGTIELQEGQKVAALHQGGLARTGPVLLHLGILALVLGGLVSSWVGRRHFVEIGPGQTVALEDSRFALRVDDFQIEKNGAGQVKQYRSKVALLEGDREVARREISVNSPLRHAGYNIYQASYAFDPTRASSLTFVVRPRVVDPNTSGTTDPAAAHASPVSQHAHTAAGVGGDPHAACGMESALQSVVVQSGMEGPFAVPGYTGYEFHVTDFFGHLMLGPKGPVNAKRDFDNPAARIEVLKGGKPVAHQWAFAKFPAHSRGELPFTLEMHDAQPALTSGFEINTNPGAPLVWFGFALSTLGLVLAFLVQHRCVFMLARPSERGWSLWIAGRSDHERYAFAGEFARLLRQVKAEAQQLRRQASAPRPALEHTNPNIERASREALVTPYV